MYAVTSPSELLPVARTASPAGLQRARGRLDLAFSGDSGRTRLLRCYQEGSSKARFPRSPGAPEIVMLNTAGGMTGGDVFETRCSAGDGASLTLTTQAAEKVYRSSGGDSALDVGLTLGNGARTDWLPQETIVFDGGRLKRRLDVEMAADATLTLCEAWVLGRAAFGETVREARIADRWRVRRDGRLVYADDLRIGGDIRRSTRSRATLGAARAFATVLSVSPVAETLLDTVREAIAALPAVVGASAWNGMLAVRAVAGDGQALRAALLAVLSALGIVPPRVWSI